MMEIYNMHNVGTNYIRSNYKDALRQLLGNGKIEVRTEYRATIRFADDIIVTFPKKAMNSNS